jgi:hypothetical protein
MLQFPSRTWTEHFRFARAASAYAVQHLGNERKRADARRYRGNAQGVRTHFRLNGRL